jgi:hypothetical protein
MDVPTIFDVLDRLEFLRGMPSTIIILLAAFVAVTAWDMRLSLPAMLVQYLFAGLLIVEVLDPRLAVVYTLAGLFVCAILAITAWQVNWGRPPGGLTSDEAARLGLSRRRSFGRVSVTDRSFLRLGLAVVALAAAAWVARLQGAFLLAVPEELAHLEPAIIGLVGLGLVNAAASTEPLPSGISLLLFLSGFALYYGFLDQSILMTVALVATSILVALVIAYLAQARYLPADVLD